MNDTGANMDRWTGLYGVGGAPAAEATVVTAAAGTVSSSPTRPSGGVHPGKIEGGRVGKPARLRRSRASRRAPVTLLNTDTSNFRAMVQQFTGVPSGSAGAGDGPVISFRAGEYCASPSVMSFDDHHHHQQQHRQPPTSSLQQGQQQLFRPQHGQQYGYDMPPFLHGFEPSSSAAEEDRLLLQSIQAAQTTTTTTTMPSRPASCWRSEG